MPPAAFIIRNSRLDTRACTQPLDVLAAHRDDGEQSCGSTLLKRAARGHRTGILDLTQEETGTRGTAEQRARQAAEATHVLNVSWF